MVKPKLLDGVGSFPTLGETVTGLDIYIYILLFTPMQSSLEVYAESTRLS